MLLRHQLLDGALLEVLVESGNPVPLRLVAADALLAAGPHDSAVAALRDIARLPNREIALATADVVQRRLGVVPAGRQLGESELVGGVAVDLVGAHEDERCLRTMAARRLQPFRCRRPHLLVGDAMRAHNR